MTTLLNLKKLMDYKEYFIPFNTPSLKNSRIKTSRGVFHSKTVGKYLRDLGIQSFSSTKKTMINYKNRPNIFLESMNGWKKPTKQILLGFHIVRDSKRNADFHNIVQVIFDLMTAADFIIDDSMKYVLPTPYKKNGSYYSINKDNPGCFIKIIKDGDI